MLAFVLPLIIAQAELPAVPPAEAWRKDRPKAQAPKAPVLPVYEKAVLDNGLTILVSRVEPLPLLTIALTTKGGATLDPPGKAGVSNFAYRMLEEGAGELDAMAFSDKVADLGASFGARGDRDQGSVTISGLSKHADAMLALMTSVVLSPRHDPKDFERAQQQLLADLERSRGSPQGLAFERIPALIYGADHPFGHPPSGTPETIRGLTLADIKAQHARIFSPKTSALVITGDITLEEAKTWAQKYWGAWTSDAPPLPQIPALEAQARSGVVWIDKPGPQTMVILGRPLFALGHPDQYPLIIANEIYGGNFTSRLNMNLREEKGYTYGAGSQTSFRTSVGVFIAYSAIRADATGAGLGEFFAEMSGLQKEPLTAEEVDDAKAGQIRSFTGSFEQTSDVAGAAAAIFVYDLPLDHYSKLPEKYAAVTLSQAQAAADQYLKPELMQVLLVGDAANQAAVQLLNLGPIDTKTP